MTRIARYLTLLIIPVAMVMTTLSIGAAKGPYWVGMNHDPSVQYLLNSLNLATLRPVGHTVHPGTPVQFAGAAVLRAVHLVAAPAGEDLEQHLLANPGLYLRAIQLTFLFLNALAVFILGVATLKALNILSLALIVQLAPFYPHVLSTFGFGTTEVRPESFLFLSTILLATGLVLYTQRAAELNSRDAAETAGQRHTLQWRAAVGFGLIGGFGMAAKVGFLPLLLIPIFALRGHRYRLIYLASMMSSFVLVTLPILAEYPRMALWLFRVAVHSGVHGQGSATFVDPDLFVTNLKTLIALEVVFASVLALSAVVLTASYVVPRFRKIAAGNVYFHALMGVMSAQAAGLAIAAKHSKGWEVYYLMPVSILTGLSLMLTICCVVLLATNTRTPGTRATPPGGSMGRPWRDLVLPVSAATVLVGLIALTYDLRWTEIIHVNAGQSIARDQRVQVHELMNRDYAGYAKIYYLGSSSPEFALFFSNSEAKFYYSAALEKQFPNVYFYDPFTSRLYDWYYRVKRFEEITRWHGDRVVFQGPPFAELEADVSMGVAGPSSFKAPKVPLAEVTPSSAANDYRQRRETIYVFRPKGRPSN